MYEGFVVRLILQWEFNSSDNEEAHREAAPWAIRDSRRVICTVNGPWTNGPVHAVLVT